MAARGSGLGFESLRAVQLHEEVRNFFVVFLSFGLVSWILMMPVSSDEMARLVG